MTGHSLSAWQIIFYLLEKGRNMPAQFLQSGMEPYCLKTCAIIPSGRQERFCRLSFSQVSSSLLPASGIPENCSGRVFTGAELARRAGAGQ